MIWRSLIIVIGSVLLVACSTKQKVTTESKPVVAKENVVVEGGTEYGVEMFDAKFEAWYRKYKNSGLGIEQSYYEEWNQKYVPAWNKKARSASRDFPFQPVVGFNPQEDYGFELNHKLFHYFMYVEQVLNIEIIQEKPNFVIQ